MEIVLINNETINQFKDMMGNEVAAGLCANEDIFGMGLVDKNEVYGEIVVEINGNAAVIRSLYIVPEHRREGTATILLLEASAYAGMNAAVDGFSVEFVEDMVNDNGLRGFFEYCGFDLTENPDLTTYTLTLRELMDSPYLQGDIPTQGLKTYAQLTHEEINSLMDENVLYMPLYIQEKMIEPDVSYFLTDNGAIRACIVVIPEDDMLSVGWMRVTPANYKALIVILRSAGNAALAKYGADRKVILPIVSKEANQLVNKLFGDSLVRIEKSCTGVMMFEDDEYEATEYEEDEYME